MSNIYKHKNFKESLKSACRGLGHTIKTERNARTIVILGIVTLFLALVAKIALIELGIILLTVALVFICEVFNTLVENMTDLLKNKHDPYVKLLKDMASGAVFLSALASLGIASLIFLPRILQFFR